MFDAIFGGSAYPQFEIELKGNRKRTVLLSVDTPMSINHLLRSAIDGMLHGKNLAIPLSEIALIQGKK